MTEFNKSVVFDTVAMMFLMLCVGYAARKLKFIDSDFSKKLSNLVICVAQPFMILAAMMEVRYTPDNLRTAVFITVMGISVHIIAAAIAFVASIKIKDQDERKLSEFGIIFANCGFMGFPVLKALFGDIGGFWGAFYIIVFNIMQWTYGMIILGRGRDDIKVNFKKMVLNYGTIPCLMGVALFLLRFEAPVIIYGASHYLGSLCTPLSMLILGAMIATIPPKKLLLDPKIYYYSIVKLFAVPFIVIITGRLLGLSAEMIMFAAVMSSLPTAANTVMFAERHDIKPDYAAHAVGMSTLLSVLSVPAMIYFADFIIKL